MKILHTADWHIGQFKGPVVDGVNLRSQDTVKCLEYTGEMCRIHSSTPQRPGRSLGRSPEGHQPVWILQAGRGTGKPDTNSQRGGKAAWLPGDMP